jgi:hypothetical protein
MPNYACATIKMFDVEHGGRQSPVTGVGCLYRPHLKCSSGSEYLGVCFVDGPDVIALGETVDVTFLLIYDGVDYSCLTPGATFVILEGPHIVGEGIMRKRSSSNSELHGYRTPTA